MEDNKKNKKIPRHIGLVISGNGHWAKERNLPKREGHLKAYEKIEASSVWFFSRGVKELSYFMFSSKDWSREREEVNCIMKLLREKIEKDLANIGDRGYRIVFSGKIDQLPGDLPASCKELEFATKTRKNGIINLCINYDGRQEIVDAVKRMIKAGIDIDQIHEGIFRKYLYRKDFGDLDFIVNMSGKKENSGFLMWQSTGAQIIFLKKFWPDFEEIDAEMIVNQYDE
jgi:undecaprenyl diphosphate synthase